MKCLTFPTERKTFLCLHFCLNFQSPLRFYSRLGYVTRCRSARTSGSMVLLQPIYGTISHSIRARDWSKMLKTVSMTNTSESTLDPIQRRVWKLPRLTHRSHSHSLNVAQLTVWVCFPQVELPHCPHPHSHGNKIPDYSRVIVNKNKPEKQKTE